MLAERRIRRRAGASAAAEYARLTREWRQRNRRFFRWGAVLCFIVVTAALLLGLGQLRGWLCGLLAGMSLAFYVLMRETPPAWIGHYLTGAVERSGRPKRSSRCCVPAGSLRTISTAGNSTSTMS